MRLLPLDENSMDLEIDLCLRCHPSGVVVNGEAAEEGRDAKRLFLQGVLERVNPAGFVAEDSGAPVALLELMPRDVARLSGYVTGDEGEDGRTLTVACLEVAHGYERKPTIRMMVGHLVGNLGLFRPYRRIEVGGFPGDVDFNPAWVYEEAGFTVDEDRETVKILSVEIPT